MGMQICPLFPDASGTGGRDEDLESWIAVGMTVEVVKRGKHLYIPQQPQLAAGGAKGKK